jgi:hypothetical protein
MDILLRYFTRHALLAPRSRCFITSGKSGRHLRPVVSVVEKDADVNN